MTDAGDLVERLLAGEHRALARAITRIENREPGYRELVAALHGHAGDAEIVGITGSPGAGKSTLVDKLAARYRERDLTVGVIAVDPSSPYSGGAVLGDRVRMASNYGDMDVFVRSMSARGALGGLATATADAVTALDAFGKDRILIETVGAGQNEVEVVRTADTVVLVLQPGAGDDVQMLKAGILEIGDVFVVNKADLEGADRTVTQVREMLRERAGEAGAPARYGGADPDHHGGSVSTDRDDGGTREGRTAESDDGDDPAEQFGVGSSGRPAGTAEGANWEPPLVETVATEGEGVADLLAALADHREFLETSGLLGERARTRAAAGIRRLVREDLGDLAAAEIRRRGGLEALVDAVLARETDPYTVAEEVVGPVADCVEDRED